MRCGLHGILMKCLGLTMVQTMAYHFERSPSMVTRCGFHGIIDDGRNYDISKPQVFGIDGGTNIKPTDKTTRCVKMSLKGRVMWL